MSDQNQNYTAKSFSSVWVFLWLQTPAQNPSALLQNTLVSSGPYSALQITLFQSRGVQLPMKLANTKKLHRKWCAFLFVCNLTLSSDNCFLSGTFIAFYKNFLISVSFPHFFQYRNRPCCYDQLPQNTVTSLCKCHPQHHCGASPSFLPQVAFLYFQYLQLCS